MSLTIRLDETERDELKEIMERLEEKTKNGAIRKIISSYMGILSELETKKYKNISLQGELDDIQSLLLKKKNAENEKYNCELKLHKWAKEKTKKITINDLLD